MATKMIDVAKKAGVARETVSHVINNRWKEKGISETTKARICNIIEELDYKRNNIAMSLVTGKTNTLGLVIPCVTESFFPKITRGIENVARNEDYCVILCHSDTCYQTEEKEVATLLRMKVDGLIITPGYERDDVAIYKQLQNRNIPFVLIDSYVEGIDCSFVVTDDRIGACEAVNHLVKLGHRCIAHISGAPKYGSSKARLKGYRESLMRHGISFNPNLVKGGGFSEEIGYKAAKELLDINEKPTAVFCVADQVALGCIKALKESGIKVPEEMAVVGFADLSYASIMEVPLTTVRQPALEIGKIAAQIIIEQIRGHILDIKKVMLKPTLIIRKSCGADLNRCGAEARNIKANLYP